MIWSLPPSSVRRPGGRGITSSASLVARMRSVVAGWLDRKVGVPPPSDYAWSSWKKVTSPAGSQPALGRTSTAKASASISASRPKVFR